MDADAAGIPTLQGDVVRLRPVTMADAPRLAQILSHPGVVEWWGHHDLERVQAEVIAPDDGTVVFAVEAEGQVVGLIQYLEENEPDYRHASIDISLHPDWHHRGLGADALRTLARHLFTERGHHRLPSTRRRTTVARSARTRALASAPLG